jgi:hypothetical protein
VEGSGFPTKNYSAEDGIDEVNGLFSQNSGCFAEQTTLGIPHLQVILRKRKMLGIPYHGTKIEAKSRNFVLWNKNTNKLLEFYSETFAEENTLSILFAGTGKFCFFKLLQNSARKRLLLRYRQNILLS